MSKKFYGCVRALVTPTYTPVVDLGDNIDSTANIMTSQEEIFYQRRDSTTDPFVCITPDATETSYANIGTSVPLSERIIGKSLWAAGHTYGPPYDRTEIIPDCGEL